MTEILTITKDHIDADGFYIGADDVSNFDGHIIIAANLGTVRFRGHLSATLSVTAQAGSGIEAGEGIKAGFSISGGWVFSGMRIFAGTCLWHSPNAEDMEVRAELRGGVIAFGNHIAPEKSQ